MKTQLTIDTLQLDPVELTYFYDNVRITDAQGKSWDDMPEFIFVAGDKWIYDPRLNAVGQSRVLVTESDWSMTFGCDFPASIMDKLVVNAESIPCIPDTPGFYWRNDTIVHVSASMFGRPKMFWRDTQSNHGRVDKDDTDVKWHGPIEMPRELK
jgi:hypothetical protein